MDRTRTGVVSVTLALVLAVCAAMPAAAADNRWPGDPPVVQIEARYWFVNDMFASALVGETVPGSNLDLRRDVFLDKHNQPELRLVLTPSENNRFRIGFTRLRFKGDGVAPFDVYFQDAMVPAGDAVKSRFELDYYYVNWAIQTGTDTFRIGPVLAVHGWRAKVGIEDLTAARRMRSDELYNNVIPAFGLAVDWNPHKIVSVYFEGSGMHQGAKGWHVDAEAGVKVYPIKALGIVAAYRRLEVRNHDQHNANYADLSVRGPYIGFDLRF